MSFKLIVVCATLLHACNCAASGLPSLVVTIESSLVDSDHRQVIPIETTIIADALTLAATRAGFGIAGSNAIPVIVRLTEYDSGQRFGGSKTATISADVLENGNSIGQATCTRTVRFDLRSTEKRNRQAVDECVGAFAQTFTARLVTAMAR